jgi:predicted transcriptional regulator
VAKTTAQRYLNNWLDIGVIKKLRDKETQTYYYQITNSKEYQNLEKEIDTILNKVITTIENRTTEPLPNHSTIKPVKTKATKEKA